MNFYEIYLSKSCDSCFFIYFFFKKICYNLKKFKWFFLFMSSIQPFSSHSTAASLTTTESTPTTPSTSSGLKVSTCPQSPKQSETSRRVSHVVGSSSSGATSGGKANKQRFYSGGPMPKSSEAKRRAPLPKGIKNNGPSSSPMASSKRSRVAVSSPGNSSSHIQRSGTSTSKSDRKNKKLS